ncbi:IS6 family transposase [Chroococcidiopsis sp. CCMEE 29]|uniref:IS6 family transposase n=1 Tax=Chroococcidiopsis sp. CCMEE 29 TaxID=155894 RepID=UPI0020223B41|nr:IS6 family transposase [Chroococcidiopsis sp. CCMEE 29]
MNCPHCNSTHTTQLGRTTELGYRVFRCRECKSSFNERTGTPFNFLEVPTDIVFQVLLCRLRYKMSFRDVAEFFLLRGFEFTHETVRDWEARFAVIFANQLRAKRKGKVSDSWYVDETYIRVKGKWCYLYRAIDRDGNLVDSMLSEKRDMEAAQVFFTEAIRVAQKPPERVTTDGHTAYPRAIAEVLGAEVEHRVSDCLTNRIEQDHRGIKQRYYPMLGFGAFGSAKRYCLCFDEIRNYFRPRRRMREFVSLSQRRDLFVNRVQQLRSIFQAA